LNIKKKLSTVAHTTLVQLVDDLYGRYGDIDDLIETHLQRALGSGAIAGVDNQGSSGVLRNAIERELSQLKELEFVDYQQTSNLYCQLQSLLLDIDALAEEDLQAGLGYAETFINTHVNVLNSCDDSDGDIGCVYREAVDQWLEMAAELRETDPKVKNWMEAVLNFFDNNDYACLDDVISHSHILLTEEELNQLAWRFENRARQALKSPALPSDGEGIEYNAEAAHACLGMESVACALNDITLYEKSYLLGGQALNPLQLAAIVEFALDIEAFERAQYWLDQPVWASDKRAHSRLTNALLQRQGDTEALTANLYQLFMENPSAWALEVYLNVASDAEVANIIPTVLVLVEQPECYAPDAVEMLLLIDNIPLAACTCLARWDEIPGTHYTTLLSWVEVFQSNAETLAAIIGLRILLLDILERGKTKAYHHAADYFYALIALDHQQPDYQSFDDAHQFIVRLQQAHGRKRSFWAAADFPNK